MASAGQQDPWATLQQEFAQAKLNPSELELLEANKSVLLDRGFISARIIRQATVEQLTAADVDPGAAVLLKSVFPVAGFWPRFLGGLIQWLSGFWGPITRADFESLKQVVIGQGLTLQQILQIQQHNLKLITTTPSANNSSLTKKVLAQLRIGLIQNAPLPHCCALPVLEGEPAYPEFVVDEAASEKQIMLPARTYLQERLVPPGVLVLMVDSRDSLYHNDLVNLVQIRGKTDFLVLDREAAFRILGNEVDVNKQPSEEDIEVLLQLAVLCLVELKTPREVEGNAYRHWPQAVLESVALKYISGRQLPVFAGDINNMVLIHWAPTSDADDDDEQQEQQQLEATLHIGTAQSRGVTHAAMRLMIQQEQDKLRASGPYQQLMQRQRQQSPGDRHNPALRGRSAAGSSSQGLGVATAPAVRGVQTRTQLQAAAMGAHTARADWVAAADTPTDPFAATMKAAVDDVEEGIEECADADLSALDQCKGRVCPANRRFEFTLKEGLPALLAGERAKQQQQMNTHLDTVRH